MGRIRTLQHSLERHLNLTDSVTPENGKCFRVRLITREAVGTLHSPFNFQCVWALGFGNCALVLCFSRIKYARKRPPEFCGSETVNEGPAPKIKSSSKEFGFFSYRIPWRLDYFQGDETFRNPLKYWHKTWSNLGAPLNTNSTGHVYGREL